MALPILYFLSSKDEVLLHPRLLRKWLALFFLRLYYTMPGKRYSQHYHFTVVIHNVKDDTLKSKLELIVKELQSDWSLIAQEPYNDDFSPGSHIHVFLKYQKKKSWKMVLNFFQKHSDGYTHQGKFTIPKGKHQGKEATLGHVKVKPGKGDFNQCKKYVTDPDKIKKLDNNVTENVRYLTLVERHPEAARKCPGCGERYYDPVSDFCGTPVIMGECWKCYGKSYSKRFPLNLPQEATPA